jgi:hypothetical protein
MVNRAVRSPGFPKRPFRSVSHSAVSDPSEPSLSRCSRIRGTQESPGRSNRSRGFKPLAGVRFLSFGGVTVRSALSLSL